MTFKWERLFVKVSAVAFALATSGDVAAGTALFLTSLGDLLFFGPLGASAGALEAVVGEDPLVLFLAAAAFGPVGIGFELVAGLDGCWARVF